MWPMAVTPWNIMRGFCAVGIILPLDIIVIPKQAFAPLLQTEQEHGENEGLSQLDIPYIFESNPHLVFAATLNEKKLVRASNPHLSFNRPLPTGRLFE
jgi:hypothetical protein